MPKKNKRDVPNSNKKNKRASTSSKKKPAKSDSKAIAIRRNGDISFNNDQKQAIERFLGGETRVKELARKYAAQSLVDDVVAASAASEGGSSFFSSRMVSLSTKNTESVRLVLAQSKNQSKMIVCKRLATGKESFEEVLQKAIPKLSQGSLLNRKQLSKVNSMFVLIPQTGKVQVFDTASLEDGSLILFEYIPTAEDQAEAETSTTTKKQAEEQEETKTSVELGKSKLDKGGDSDDDNDEEEEDSGDDENGEESGEEQGDDDEDEDEEEEEDGLGENQENEVETVSKDIYERAKQVYLAEKATDPTPTAVSSSSHQLIDFKTVRSSRCDLPIDKSEQELLQAISLNQVTVIRAPTGSGKSTRLVQFLLENQPSARMIVTEPRRIAAMTVSERVAFELKTRLGQVVGYSIRAENVSSKSTQIMFCTVGVLLRRLAHDPQLKGITHVVVDEAHERDVLTDLLLIFLKDLVHLRADLKIIVLSATMDTSAFSEYFSSPQVKVAECEIEGRTFPIEHFFLEQLEQMIGGSYSNHQSSKVPKQHSQQFGKKPVAPPASALIPQLNVDFIARLLKHYLRTTSSQAAGKRKSVLIFVSGRREILRTISCLKRELGSNAIECLPLHSFVSNEEQRRVFLPLSNPNRTRVIVSTNIAETSITIDDVGLVIDTGVFKESKYDADRRQWSLEEVLQSKSAMVQRRGRAGRTSPGVCYHVFSKELILDEQTRPGMLKDSLEDAVMTFKAVQGGENAFKFFAKAITPPPPETVERILEDLSDLGVIRGEFMRMTTQDKTELTPLGFHLAKLGTDCRVGKLLLFGCFFDCLDPILTIAATMDGKNPFVVSFAGGANNTPKLRRWFGSDDFSAFVKAREVFLASERGTSSYRRRNRDEDEEEDDDEEETLVVPSGHSAPSATHQQDRAISKAAMRLNEKLRDDFISDLYQAGFIDSKRDVAQFSKYGKDWSVVKICLAAGMFPFVGKVSEDGFSVLTGPHRLEPSKLDFTTLWPAERHKYFVYHERARLGESPILNVRRACDVSPMALLLFGGGFTRIRSRKAIKDPEKQSRFVSIRLGNCWVFKARIKDAFLLVELRKILDEALLKIYERKTLSAKDEDLIRLIRQISA